MSMNMSLFSYNLLLLFCALVVSLLTFQIMDRDKKWRKKHLKIALLVAVCASGLLYGVVQWYFRADAIPPALVIWFAPFGFSIYLVVGVERRLRPIAITLLTITVALLFGLLMTNKYYRYYPTLSSVFGKDGSQRLATQESAVTIYRSHTSTDAAAQITEQLYTPKLNQTTKGSLYNLDIPGTVSGFKSRTARLYVPPAAVQDSSVELPVVVLMAGIPGAPEDWINGGGLVGTLDSFASRHKGLAPLVVVVDHSGSRTNDTECVDSPRGKAETYLTQDVPNYIKSNFRVKSSSQYWAIGGLSDGGLCGLTLTLRHPDIYTKFLDFGGDSSPSIGTKQQTVSTLFGGSESEYQAHNPVALLAKKADSYSGISGWFEVASDDAKPLVQGIRDLYAQSKTLGLPTNLEITKGHHTFDVWKQSLDDALPWLSYTMSLTICEKSCQ